jgi:hypothetical protein
MRDSNLLNSNHHWRPQSDFLVYREYDDYFCLEDMDAARETLRKKSDFKVIDARSKTAHGTDNFDVNDNLEVANHRAITLYNMKLKNIIPSYECLYNDELIALVSSIYVKDIALFSKVCDKSNLLFTL